MLISLPSKEKNAAAWTEPVCLFIFWLSGRCFIAEKIKLIFKLGPSISMGFRGRKALSISLIPQMPQPVLPSIFLFF